MDGAEKSMNIYYFMHAYTDSSVSFYLYMDFKKPRVCIDSQHKIFLKINLKNLYTIKMTFWGCRILLFLMHAWSSIPTLQS